MPRKKVKQLRSLGNTRFVKLIKNPNGNKRTTINVAMNLQGIVGYTLIKNRYRKIFQLRTNSYLKGANKALRLGYKQVRMLY